MDTFRRALSVLLLNRSLTEIAAAEVGARPHVKARLVRDQVQQNTLVEIERNVIGADIERELAARRRVRAHVAQEVVDDLQAVLDNMIANAGQLHMSDALQLDPAPVPRLLETTTECGPGS